MPVSKRPRKRRAARQVVLVMPSTPTTEQLIDWELKVLTFVDAVSTGSYNPKVGFNMMLFLVACQASIGKRDPEVAATVALMVDALRSITDRHSNTGKWGCSGDERRLILERATWLVDLFKAESPKAQSQGLAHSAMLLSRCLTTVGGLNASTNWHPSGFTST